MKNLRIYIIISAAVLLLLLYYFNRSEGIIQPISFDHHLHVEEQELECETCHTGVNNHSRATLPGIDVCTECHEEENSGSEIEKRLVSYVMNKEEIPWKRIYQVPDHVYFSHRRHVISGKIFCASCHGDVKKLETPPEYPLVEPSMDFCMECHEKKKITNDCLACHR